MGRVTSLLPLQRSAGTRQFLPYGGQEQLRRLALRLCFHEVAAHLGLPNLVNPSLPHDLALRLFRCRVGLRQVLPGLRQRLLQVRLVFLTLDHCCLGISQLLLHGRQHAPPHGSHATDTVQLRLLFRQRLLRARQHLRGSAVAAPLLRQGRADVRQFLPRRRQRRLHVSGFALGTCDLRPQACRRRSRLR